MRTLRIGDHIKVRRSLQPYTHHGIYVGDDCVVHYASDPWDKPNARVEITSLYSFSGGEPVRIVRYDDCWPAKVTFWLAILRLAEQKYALWSNNCESFARWCKTGESKSEQVETFKTVVATIPVVATTAMTLGPTVVNRTAAATFGGVLGGLGSSSVAGTALTGSALTAGPLLPAVALGAVFGLGAKWLFDSVTS